MFMHIRLCPTYLIVRDELRGRRVILYDRPVQLNATQYTDYFADVTNNLLLLLFVSQKSSKIQVSLILQSATTLTTRAKTLEYMQIRHIGHRIRGFNVLTYFYLYMTLTGRTSFILNISVYIVVTCYYRLYSSLFNKNGREEK